MTIKICVIEDETIFQEQIKKIVELYEAKNSFPIEAEYYSSSTPGLIQHACDFHLFILDIQLNNENGIAIAKQLRTAGYKGSIVFLTSYEDYVFDGYNVNALNYLLKPLTYEQFYDCVTRVAERLENQYFTFRHKSSYQRVPYSDILYFTSRNQYVEIITSTENIFINEPLKCVLNHLPLYFVQCHRTIIVNLDFVEKIVKQDAFLSDGTLLPISRQYLNPLREQFLQHLQIKS